MSPLPKRTSSQKIGSRGHRWALAEIEKHADWLARSLDEDFGLTARQSTCLVRQEGTSLSFSSKPQRT